MKCKDLAFYLMLGIVAQAVLAVPLCLGRVVYCGMNLEQCGIYPHPSGEAVLIDGTCYINKTEHALTEEIAEWCRLKDKEAVIIEE